ncbi:MAG: hypothetical protein WBP41_03815 [Saprospiraceae bacterium]
MSELEIQQSIIQALNRLSMVQKLKLLESIKSMLAVTTIEKHKGLLQFSNVFDSADTHEFKLSLKDTEQIDKDER